MSAKDPIGHLVRELTDALMKEPFKQRHYAESVARSFFESHAHGLATRLRERLPMGYKHWADVYLDSPEGGEVECSHEGLECQWSRCQEKKPPEVSE